MIGKSEEHEKDNQEDGFTIIELLIATLIFSMVLIVLVIATTGFFTVYYKSVVNSSVQGTIQNISNVVEQSIKYSAAEPVQVAPAGNNPGLICAGGEEFVYFLDDEEPTELPGGATYALYEMPEVNPCTSTTYAHLQTSPEWSDGRSLLGTHYRLINFYISELANPSTDWVVDVKLAYTSGGTNGAGDELLCSPSIQPSSLAGGCNPTAANLQGVNWARSDITCKTAAGSQFCDVAELQSIIENRLN